LKSNSYCRREVGHLVNFWTLRSKNDVLAPLKAHYSRQCVFLKCGGVQQEVTMSLALLFRQPLHAGNGRPDSEGVKDIRTKVAKATQLK
jgi:hypothetical protein